LLGQLIFIRELRRHLTDGRGGDVPDQVQLPEVKFLQFVLFFKKITYRSLAETISEMDPRHGANGLGATLGHHGAMFSGAVCCHVRSTVFRGKYLCANRQGVVVLQYGAILHGVDPCNHDAKGCGVVRLTLP
jgi:hypothetical protein